MSSRVLVSLRMTASPQRTFAIFTEEIGEWWRFNPLFAFTPAEVRGDTGKLWFEPGPDGRLFCGYASGETFEIGRIFVWAPPERLAFTWRQASFAPDQETRVEVRFEPVGAETRVTVEHTGWEAVPAIHAVRHGFPDTAFLARHGEWWRDLLRRLGERIESRR